MTPAIVGSAIGAAAVTAGRGALSAVGNGLSFAAELARAATGAAESPAGEKARQADAARAVLDSRSDELRQRIERQLAAAGVQLTEAVELISNGMGGIAVAGEHPQRAAIDEALGSDVLLERDFNLLAGDYDELVTQAAISDLPPLLTIRLPKSM